MYIGILIAIFFNDENNFINDFLIMIIISVEIRKRSQYLFFNDDNKLICNLLMMLIILIVSFQ